MDLINAVRKNLNKAKDIDDIRYISGYDYNQSVHRHITFPELKGLDLFSIIPEPYKNSSKETEAELREVVSNTKALSKSDKLKEFTTKVDKEPLFIYQPVLDRLGIRFPEGKFLSLYYNSVYDILDHLKHYYNRPRPTQLMKYYDMEIPVMVTSTHQTPAYPSGHTAYAALASAVLSDRYPEHTKIFNDLADQVGMARQYQGVHYPSDSSASIKLIKAIYPKLKEYYEEQTNEL
jgi:hypothetical protein